MTLPSADDLAIITLACGVAFTVLWYLDHRTHLAIWERDISDGELRTHRLILYASWVLQGSLVLAAWRPWLALPLIVGSWITRIVHEGIDELHWHLPRCSEREAMLHLGMWLAVQSGTVALFIWSFFLRFEGFLEQPWWTLPTYGTFLVATTAIGHRELSGYKTRTPAAAPPPNPQTQALGVAV